MTRIPIVTPPKPGHKPLFKTHPKQDYEPLIKKKEKECKTFQKDGSEFTSCGDIPGHMIHILTKIMGWKEKEVDK